MFHITDLVVGDRVTIAHGNHDYVSNAQDLPEPDVVVIARPTLQGVPLHLADEEEVEVIFKRTNGILSFRAVQINRVNTDGLPLIHLRAVSPVERSQRRGDFRMEKVLQVRLTYSDPAHPDDEPISISAHTVNISGGGCRLMPSHPIGHGTAVGLRIRLGDEVVEVTGDVVRVEEATGRDRVPVVGIRFHESESGRARILQYINAEQRKLLSSRKK